MPPIPSTFDEQTQDLISSLHRRQKDLSEFQIPRLRTCKGPLVLQQEYAAEVREDIDSFARGVETLDISVDDQRGERNRRELRFVVDDFKETLVRLRKDSRAALLTSKRLIDSGKVSNREELLRSSAMREKQDLNEKVTEDALMKANNDVTSTLQRTIGLMQSELERSVLSTQLLESSTASLRSTSTTHDVLDNLMSTSKHLITALEKSDWLDRLLILAGLTFFILVILFILKERLVDRSLRIALFWTRWIPSSSVAATRVGDVEKGLGSASGVVSMVGVVASSSLGLVSSVLSSSLSSGPSPSPSKGEASLSDILTSILPDENEAIVVPAPLPDPSLSGEHVEEPTPSPGVGHDEL